MADEKKQQEKKVVIRYDALEKWTVDETKAIAAQVKSRLAPYGERFDPLCLLIATMAVEQPQLRIDIRIDGPVAPSPSRPNCSIHWFSDNGILFLTNEYGMHIRAMDVACLDRCPYYRQKCQSFDDATFLHSVYIDILHKYTLSKWRREIGAKRAGHTAFMAVIMSDGDLPCALKARDLAYVEYERKRLEGEAQLVAETVQTK